MIRLPVDASLRTPAFGTLLLLLLVSPGNAVLTAVKSGDRKASAYDLADSAERMADYVVREGLLMEKQHDEDLARIQAAMVQARSATDKALLEDAAQRTEEDRLAERNSMGNVLRLVTSLNQALGSHSTVASCDQLSCGELGYCAKAPPGAVGARCRCVAGYEGDGFVCNTPTSFTESPLLGTRPGKPEPPRLAELQVSTLSGNKVAAVYRDLDDHNRGYVLIGQAQQDGVNWSTPVLFSGDSAAFGPKFVELQGGSDFMILFRERDRGGRGLIMAGSRDPQSDKLTFSETKPFARDQAQGAVLLPLSKDLLAVLYSEHAPGSDDRRSGPGALYGTALLLEVKRSTEKEGPQVPVLRSKQRFARGPVARLTATLLSPTSFVVAFRHRDPATKRSHEAACTVGELINGELAFQATPMELEQGKAQIWTRSVAPVSDTAFSYTYHSGEEKATKQAVIQFDRSNRRLLLVSGPKVISTGFTPYVGSFSSMMPPKDPEEKPELLQAPATSHSLLTFFGGKGGVEPNGHLCRVGTHGVPEGCRDVAWNRNDVVHVSAAPVGDGRFVIAFLDARGHPTYQLFGLK